MEKGKVIGLIINIVLLVIVFKIITLNINSPAVVYETAQNGKESFLVLNLPDKQKTADTLAELKKRGLTLIDHLSKKYPNDPRTRKLSSFNFNNISESTDTSQYTTYSENKSAIYFCLRQKNKIAEENKSDPKCTTDKCGPFVDINTLTAVMVHELAHNGSNVYDPGHSSNFKKDQQFLLGEAQKIGLWNYTDYSKQPVDYCGDVINYDMTK